MSWEKSNYTAAGAALLSESLSGGALVITRAVSGTGTADANLSEETGVSGDCLPYPDIARSSRTGSYVSG